MASLGPRKGRVTFLISDSSPILLRPVIQCTLTAQLTVPSVSSSDETFVRKLLLIPVPVSSDKYHK